MKNLKKFIAISSIIGIAIFSSCSKEDSQGEEISQSSMMQKDSNEIDSLAAIYRNIMKTTEYANFHSNINEMTVKLNNNMLCPLDTKVKFSSWVSSNLSLTQFASVIEAEALYDDGITYCTALISANPLFYNIVQSCTEQELMIILAPEFEHPSWPRISDCVNGCINDAMLAFAINDGIFIGGMLSDNPYIQQASHVGHHMGEMFVIHGYIDCFGHC